MLLCQRLSWGTSQHIQGSLVLLCGYDGWFKHWVQSSMQWSRHLCHVGVRMVRIFVTIEFAYHWKISVTNEPNCRYMGAALWVMNGVRKPSIADTLTMYFAGFCDDMIHTKRWENERDLNVEGMKKSILSFVDKTFDWTISFFRRDTRRNGANADDRSWVVSG